MDESKPVATYKGKGILNLRLEFSFMRLSWSCRLVKWLIALSIVTGTVWRVIWTTNVYCRANPSRDSPKIGELPPQSTVTELARIGDWLQHSAGALFIFAFKLIVRAGWTLTKAGSNVVMKEAWPVLSVCALCFELFAGAG